MLVADVLQQFGEFKIATAELHRRGFQPLVGEQGIDEAQHTLLRAADLAASRCVVLQAAGEAFVESSVPPMRL